MLQLTEAPKNKNSGYMERWVITVAYRASRRGNLAEESSPVIDQKSAMGKELI